MDEPTICDAEIVINGVTYSCFYNKGHTGPHIHAGVKLNRIEYAGFEWNIDDQGRMVFHINQAVARVIFDIESKGESSPITTQMLADAQKARQEAHDYVKNTLRGLHMEVSRILFQIDNGIKAMDRSDSLAVELFGRPEE